MQPWAVLSTVEAPKLPEGRNTDAAESHCSLPVHTCAGTLLSLHRGLSTVMISPKQVRTSVFRHLLLKPAAAHTCCLSSRAETNLPHWGPNPH